MLTIVLKVSVSIIKIKRTLIYKIKLETVKSCKVWHMLYGTGSVERCISPLSVQQLPTINNTRMDKARKNHIGCS